MTRDTGSKRAVTYEQTHLDVAVKRSLGEICRGNKDDLIVYDDCLCMKDTRRPIQIEGAGVIIDRRSGLTRPIDPPEPVSEPPHEVVRRSHVAFLTLDVQEKRGPQARP